MRKTVILEEILKEKIIDNEIVVENNINLEKEEKINKNTDKKTKKESVKKNINKKS